MMKKIVFVVAFVACSLLPLAPTKSQWAVVNVAEEMRQAARYVRLISAQLSKMVKIPNRIVRLNALITEHFRATGEAIAALSTATEELSDLKKAIPTVSHDEFIWQDISILSSSLNNVGNILESNASFLENTTEEIYDIVLTISTPFINAETATEIENIDVQAELLAALKEQEVQRKKDEQRNLINRINEDRKEIARLKRLANEKKAQDKRFKIYKKAEFQKVYKTLKSGDSVVFKLGK